MLARTVAALALLVSTIGVEYISLEDGGDAARAIQNKTARTSARVLVTVKDGRFRLLPE